MDIRDVKALSAALGNHFVLFTGSAVSAGIGPKLPMVDQVITGILQHAVKRLTPDSRYSYRLLAAYGESLKEGRLAVILRGIKRARYAETVKFVKSLIKQGQHAGIFNSFKSLLKEGRHAELLKTLKFEEFLWKI